MPSNQLSALEEQALQEVFAVLSTYKGKIREFGVNLVHTHFELQPGEILYETNDPITRVLTIKPIHTTELTTEPLATSWKFKNKEIIINQFCCDGPDIDDEEGELEEIKTAMKVAS